MTERLLPSLVFVACFLGLFALIGGLMPGFIAEGATNRREINVPDYLPAEEVASLAETIVHNITVENYLDAHFELGGHDFALKRDRTDNYIVLFHMEKLFIWYHGYESMKWKNRQGIYVDVRKVIWYPPGKSHERNVIEHETIQEEFEDTGNQTYVRYTLDHPTRALYLLSFVSFNNTAYSNFTQASNNDDFTITIGIGFDQISTNWNAWSLISGLLFFQIPQNIPFPFNIIIAMPFWVCEAYLIYRLILLALPFVG